MTQATSRVAARRSHGEDARIFAARVNHILINSPPALAANAVVAVLLAAFLWDEAPRGPFLSWLSALLGVMAARAFFLLRDTRIGVTERNAPAVCRRQFNGLLTTGLLWAAAAWLFFPHVSHVHQTFLVLIMGGMMAGALAVNAVLLRLFLAFSLPIVASLPLYVAASPSGEQPFMAAMLAIYWLLLLSVALKLRRNTSESFRLRFENLDLIADLREQRRREQELNNELSHEIEERTHMERELRRSEAKFRGLTENSPVAVFIIQNGRFAYANKAVSKLTGHSEDELRGMALADVLHPEDAPRVLERIEKRLASGGEEDPVEIRVVRKDGRVVWVQTVGKVVEHGDTPATLGTAVDVTASKEAEDRLRHMATTDVLTGLANRRHFMDIFKREFSRARRYGRQLCLLVIDADHFKAINDTHGHDAGDKALQKLAKLARDNLRDVDLLGRLGGEEFTALLPDTSGEEGIMAAERLRALAESTDIDIGGKAIRVTLSVGVGCLRESDATPDELMKRVDDSLYEAKKRGRNRVMPSS